MDGANKKARGQFYTVECDYILDGLGDVLANVEHARIIEPFAGCGDLVRWIAKTRPNAAIESFDIEPRGLGIEKRDTLLDPPNYAGAWVITNPPYLARNKCAEKSVFDKYDTNDLYKAFMISIGECAGGIVIIPAGFFLSPRDIDVRCRAAFMARFCIVRVRYFEQAVFPDTTTTVVAFSFVRAAQSMDCQTIEWCIMPRAERRTFTARAIDDWIIGGDIYKYCSRARAIDATRAIDARAAPNISVRRHVCGQKSLVGEQLTSMTLSALDSGLMCGRIGLSYRAGAVYEAKDTSRAFATICVVGACLSARQQISICARFNAIIEKKRTETWSLFLPQYRESKEYARKRIPFELAYLIITEIIIDEIVGN